jgi:hypothetical protein
MRLQRVLAILLSAGCGLSAATAAPPKDPGWPRKSVYDTGTLITYQPQVDEWKDFKELTWRMAFELRPNGGSEAIGAATMQAVTEEDNDKRLVTIRDIKILHTYFPGLEQAAAVNMEELLRSYVPSVITISLDRIVASTPKKDPVKGVAVKNDPPVIFASYNPAILLAMDGEPVMAPFQETDLEFVVNTTWRLFHDKSGSKYYLLAGDQWLTAEKLEGPWSKTKKLPKAMNDIPKDEHFADLKPFIPAPEAKKGAVLPTVFYSTKPAEVILFNGPPAYAEIPGTDLSYATNTASYLFRHAKVNQIYYLTAGRWFSASTLEGPWAFASGDLPDDFRRIPWSSPAARVLASVPGTEEAKDSVLLAQIPTTVTVASKAAAEKAKAEYNGEPNFAPVEGTKISYATNTAQKVLQLGDTYYLCLEGIWFSSKTPKGPWQTATSVPEEIYEIPPSSPVYNVTYVTQGTNSSGVVEASYTAGYMGAMMVGTSVGFFIAGGTGYYYPPYIGYYPGYWYPYYYPYPITYGAAAWYNPATGRYGAAQTVWGPYGAATRAATYNPYTGTYARAGSVATPYGRATAARAYNPYTGAAAATRQGSNAYSQWGSSVVAKNGQAAYTRHYSDARGTVGTIQGSGGGAAVGGVRPGGDGAFVGKTGGGDMYAGHDGNVYRNTGSGWQKYDSGNWNPVNSPSGSTAARDRAPSASSNQIPSLQSEAQNRQRGSASTQRTQSFSGGGFSRGGGFRGGGRRR